MSTKITRTVTIEWFALTEKEPPKDSFFDLLILTPEGLRTGRYVGADYEPSDDERYVGQHVVDGFIRGGWHFTAVTHWALVNDVIKPFADVRKELWA